MSNIGDELRKHAADDYIASRYGEDKWLSAIADRIDSEMIELPKDKDGVPIHVDDLVYLENGLMSRVTEIDIKYGGEAIEVFDGSKHVACHPSGISHTRSDSLERIADDLDEVVDAAGQADDMCEMLANFADRIRRLAEKEDNQ